MLDIKDLTVRYGPFLAVDHLAMSVGKGEIVGVVGPNGAGKSSIVKAIGGLVAPKSGRLTFDGNDLQSVPTHKRIELGISIVPEGRGLFPRMSVEENLVIAGDPLCDAKRTLRNIERCYVMFPILKERRWQAAGTLSGGQQQMVAVSMGLMSDPRLLILDALARARADRDRRNWQGAQVTGRRGADRGAVRTEREADLQRRRAHLHLGQRRRSSS